MISFYNKSHLLKSSARPVYSEDKVEGDVRSKIAGSLPGHQPEHIAEQSTKSGSESNSEHTAETEMISIAIEAAESGAPDSTGQNSLEVVAAAFTTVDSLSLDPGKNENYVDITAEEVDEVIEAAIVSANDDVDVSSYVKPEDIAKVIYQAKNVWTMAGFNFIENTVLLLKNGMAYLKLERPPSELPLPESLADEAPSGWMNWRQDSSGKILIVPPSSGYEYELKGDEVGTELLSLDKVSGGYTRSSAKSWGDTATTTWRDIVLDTNGNFRKKESSFVTSGGIGSVNEESFAASFKAKTPSGLSTSVGGSSKITNQGDVIVNNTVAQAENLAGDMYGTYRILPDGLTIELEYANGTTSRELFYETKSGIFLGGRSYISSDSVRISSTGLDSPIATNYFADASWLSILADSNAQANKHQATHNTYQPTPMHTDRTDSSS